MASAQGDGAALGTARAVEEAEPAEGAGADGERTVTTSAARIPTSKIARIAAVIRRPPPERAGGAATSDGGGGDGAGGAALEYSCERTG